MNLPEWTRDYLSIPYDDLDCWGLVKRIYSERYHIEVGELHEQPAKSRHELWQDVLDEGELVEGDVLYFNAQPSAPHVGIVLTTEYMLHSVKPIGVVIEKWTRRNWKCQLKSAYRNKLR